MFAARSAFMTGAVSVVKGSADFNGSSYLSLASNAAFGVGTGAFTIEAWVRPRAMPASYGAISRTSTGTTGIFVGFNGNSTIIHNIGSGDLISSGTYPANNVWSHVAAVRSGTTLSLFLNGTRLGTVSNSTNFPTNDLTIGGMSGTQYINSYISNYRFVKGTAVYDPTQTTYTVPTAPLAAISGTSLLTCQSPTTISDASTNNFTITNNGATASSLSPF